MGVFFAIYLSADSKKGNPACYVNLREGIDKKKEGIIVLTPFIFALFYDKNRKEIKPNSIERLRILHEVAHHILGHHFYKDEKDREDKEKAAEELVEKWIKQLVLGDNE